MALATYPKYYSPETNFYAVLLQMRLACCTCCQMHGGLLHRHFTLTLAGGLFSAALSVRQGICIKIHLPYQPGYYPAFFRWSPDFPHRKTLSSKNAARLLPVCIKTKSKTEKIQFLFISLRIIQIIIVINNSVFIVINELR